MPASLALVSSRLTASVVFVPGFSHSSEMSSSVGPIWFSSESGRKLGPRTADGGRAVGAAAARDREEAVGVDRRLPVLGGNDEGGRVEQVGLLQRADELADGAIDELEFRRACWVSVFPRRPV